MSRKEDLAQRKQEMDAAQRDWHRDLSEARKAAEKSDKSRHRYDMARDAYTLYLELLQTEGL